MGRLLAWLGAGFLILGLSAPALALRCGGRTVGEGDRKVEVLAKCGEPSWRESRVEETRDRFFRQDGDGGVVDERRITRNVEEWLYNFGPSRLLYVLRFVDGALTDVDTAGYGWLENPVIDPGVQCWSESMAKGRRKLEVLRYCGEPAAVDVREVERGRRRIDRRSRRFTERRVTVTVEEWTYNFGPHRLLYVFTFENGRVVDVRTRGYGF